MDCFTTASILRVIALWLGHENVETTQIYIHADMWMKEKALARVAAPPTPSGRFRPDDQPRVLGRALIMPNRRNGRCPEIQRFQRNLRV